MGYWLSGAQGVLTDWAPGENGQETVHNVDGLQFEKTPGAYFRGSVVLGSNLGYNAPVPDFAIGITRLNTIGPVACYVLMAVKYNAPFAPNTLTYAPNYYHILTTPNVAGNTPLQRQVFAQWVHNGITYADYPGTPTMRTEASGGVIVPGPGGAVNGGAYGALLRAGHRWIGYNQKARQEYMPESIARFWDGPAVPSVQNAAARYCWEYGALYKGSSIGFKLYPIPKPQNIKMTMTYNTARDGVELAELTADFPAWAPPHSRGDMPDIVLPVTRGTGYVGARLAWAPGCFNSMFCGSEEQYKTYYAEANDTDHGPDTDPFGWFGQQGPSSEVYNGTWQAYDLDGTPVQQGDLQVVTLFALGLNKGGQWDG